MSKAARFGDPHSCPKVEPGPVPHVGGPISSPCSEDVEIEDQPAARVSGKRVGDYAKCEAGTPDFIRMGSPNVLINDMHAARLGDETVHGGVISDGAADVEIGIPGDGIALLPRERGSASPSSSSGNGGSGSGSPSAGTGENSVKPGEPDANDNGAGSVRARFRILTAPPFRDGMELTVECQSWDPDTGGTAAAPNPHTMVRRSWDFLGTPHLANSHDSRQGNLRFSFLLRGHFDESTTHLVGRIRLSVEDAQQHTDTIEEAIEVWDSPRPMAVITPVHETFIGNPRGPGDLPDRLRFRCDSRGDREMDNGPTPLKIRQRDWRCEGPNGPITLEYDHAQGLNREVYIRPEDVAQIYGHREPLRLRLRVTNDYSKQDETEIEVTAGFRPPVAKVSKPERVSWRFFGTNEELVGGDRVRIDSLSFMEGYEAHPNHGIDSFQWHTWTGLTWQTTPAGNAQSIEITLPDEMGIVQMGVRLHVQNAAGESETAAQTGPNHETGPAEEQDLIIEIVTWMEVFLRDLKDYLVAAGVTIAVTALAEFFAFLATGAAVSRAAIIAAGSLEAAVWFCIAKFAERTFGLTGAEASRVIGWMKLGIKGGKFVRGVLLNRDYLYGVYKALRNELNYTSTEAFQAAVRQMHALHCLLIGDVSKELVEKGIEDMFAEFETQEQRR